MAATAAEPSLWDAQHYVGTAVRKYFEADPESDFAGGWFQGRVGTAEAGLQDRATKKKYNGLLFLIRYDDGDEEHVTWEDLQAILVNPTTPKGERRGGGTVAKDAAAAAEEEQQEEEADENAGPTNQHTKPSRHNVSFSDITNRRQLTLTGLGAVGASTERRSRRPVKRKTDEDFEYEEDVRAAKRAAAPVVAQARAGAKFSLRPATSGLPLVLASESSEEVPTSEGVRAAGLPGHLQRIELINFMCHEHFEMEFGPHVTFVSGTNGSGKSAVLQALQCCLGVKASQTGRAPSFKHFIRTGADEAIVRVTLHNKPYKDFDAFQHEIYGDLITVERHIARVGTASAYLLKDGNGKIHGRRRDDLDALLSTLNLNAANPVTVMTQDCARSFLAGSSTAADREKWALYMDATQLSQIRYNLEVSQVQIRQMDASISKIREAYEAMQLEHDGLAKAIEALRGLEAWRQEITQYEQVLAWACVDEHAASVAQLEGLLGSVLPQRLAETERQVAELEAQVAAFKQSTSEKEQFLLHYSERAKALTEEARALKDVQTEARRAVVGARRKLQALAQRLREEMGRKEALMTAVQEASSQLDANTQAVAAAHMRHLEEADRNCKRVAEQAKAASEAKERAQADLAAAEDEQARVERDLRTNATQMRRIQESVAQLRQATANSLFKFGGNAVVELVKRLGESRTRQQFHHQPIGPLGYYLSLGDNKWAAAMESCLGANLNTWLAGDMHDCQKLQALIHGIQGWKPFKPSVVVVNYAAPLHSIPPSSQPRPGVLTVLRTLSCSHACQAHTVINYLVDSAAIEKTALGETRRECQQLAWGGGGQQVKQAYELDGSKYWQKGGTQSSTGPPHWMRYQPLRLGSDERQQSGGLQQEERRLKEEWTLLEQELVLAQQRVRAASEAARAARLANAGVQREVFQYRTQLETLISQPPPEVAATQGAAAGSEETAEEEVQREILEATQAVVDLEQQQSEKQSEVAAAERAEQEAHEAWQAKKLAIDRLDDENAQFLGNYQADVEQLAQVQAALQAAAEQHAAMERKRVEVTVALEHQQAALEANSALAPKVCDRKEAAAARLLLEAALRAKDEGVQWDEARLAQWFSSKIIVKKITRLRQKIVSHEKEAGGTLEDLEIKFEAVQTKMAVDGRRFQAAIGAYDLMTAALDRRFDKLKKLFRSVHDGVNRLFNQYMARKGHLGSIKLDTEAQTLQLKVAIGGRAGGEASKAAVKDLKQLSGGERSFTTVAFTLALGAQTDMPFRAMDEFDVFMDAINRRVAMESLFGFAREHDELQFVFLTPQMGFLLFARLFPRLRSLQDIAAVEDARQGCRRMGLHLPEDFVKVVQMRAARANATHA